MQGAIYNDNCIYSLQCILIIHIFDISITKNFQQNNFKDARKNSLIVYAKDSPDAKGNLTSPCSTKHESK